MSWGKCYSWECFSVLVQRFNGFIHWAKQKLVLNNMKLTLVMSHKRQFSQPFIYHTGLYVDPWMCLWSRVCPLLCGATKVEVEHDFDFICTLSGSDKADSTNPGRPNPRHPKCTALLDHTDTPPSELRFSTVKRTSLPEFTTELIEPEESERHPKEMATVLYTFISS